MPENRLARQPSPYLKQHAHNPVDWYPWGDEAFEKARTENKPVFLSIGYSTCHWCHVMAHESFENDTIASILNSQYVSIKVDREERPDIDSTYMTAAQLLGGGGGWPLSVFLTPDRIPFFSGTYFPPDDRYGRKGFGRILGEIAELWKTQRDKIISTASQVKRHLGQVSDVSVGAVPGRDILRQAVDEFAARYDSRFGGFDSSPKFPMGYSLSFLFRAGKVLSDDEISGMVLRALDAMASGGIYDQIGGGFHRYSTDAQWLIPHFEKMLYDQALLIEAYLDGFQIDGNQRYADTVGEVLTYINTRLTDPDSGAFYSAEDADSEGREGTFYVWTPEQIQAVLGPDDARLACEYFEITDDGNFEGSSVLTRPDNIETFADEHSIEVPVLMRRITAIRNQLLTAREARAHPFRDEKVLTDWNGLMLSALARAAFVLDNSSYADSARRAAQYLLSVHENPDGTLAKHSYAGTPHGRGTLEDYAFLSRGLLDLYTATSEPVWLDSARELCQKMSELFWDDREGGFFMTGEHDQDIPIRQKVGFDSAIPSGNAIAGIVLMRLAHIDNDQTSWAMFEKLLRAFSGSLTRAASPYAGLLTAFAYYIGPRSEIVVAGDGNREELISPVRTHFLPFSVFSTLGPSFPKDKVPACALAAAEHPQEKATLFLCREYTCSLPTSDPDEARAKLNSI